MESRESHTMRSNPSESRPLYRMVEPLVLASASPRRRRMLRSMGLEFDIVPSGADEAESPDESPYVTVERWASEKAEAVSRLRPDRWVLGADTIVVLEGRIFGKPRNFEDAVSMIGQLSGRAHEVVSAMAIAHHERGFLGVRSVSTQVFFRRVSKREIMAYVGTGEPLDKAGAYGIQGMGAFLVEAINGSYTNVVGLPLCQTLEWLMELGVIAVYSE